MIALLRTRGISDAEIAMQSQTLPMHRYLVSEWACSTRRSNVSARISSFSNIILTSVRPSKVSVRSLPSGNFAGKNLPHGGRNRPGSFVQLAGRVTAN